MVSRSASLPCSFTYGSVLFSTPPHDGGKQTDDKNHHADDDDGNKSLTDAIRNNELFSRGAFLLRQSCHSYLLPGK